MQNVRGRAQVLWDRLSASDINIARAAASLIGMLAAPTNTVLAAPSTIHRLDACCLGGGRVPRHDFSLARSACMALQKLPVERGSEAVDAAGTAARDRALASCVDHICAMVRGHARAPRWPDRAGQRGRSVT